MATYLKTRKHKGQKLAESREGWPPAGQHTYTWLLGLHSSDTRYLMQRIRRGLSYSAFEQLQRHFDLPAQELARIAQMSTRTLNRRKKDGRLEPDESDRLVRLARVFAMVLSLFEGDQDAARDWLGRRQVALGGSTPLDILETEVGAREVEALVGQLEHGVFA